MANRPLPSQELLLNLFSYNPESGEIRHRQRGADMFKPGNTSSGANCDSWNRKYAGQPAGMRNPNGYLSIRVADGRVFRAHRIIWKMMTGNDPNVVDHINGNTRDNRWLNLRSVTHSVNCRNASKRVDNTTGSAGIFYCPHLKRKPWRVRITVDRKNRNLGYFSTFEEALSAREIEKTRLGFTERHGLVSL